MKHIYIEKPYGSEAICFYEFVFGAKVISNVAKRIQKSGNKGTTRFESSQLKFGPDCIIVSERNPDSSLVDKSNCTGVEAPTIIRLDVKDIDPVVTRAKKLDVVVEEQELIRSANWRLATIKDPYGIIWLVRSSKDKKDGKQGDEIKEADKVTFWEKQQHIYVKAPNGHKAIDFCKSVFLAKEVTSNEQTKMFDEKASTSMVTSELNFGCKKIIISEVELDYDTSLIDKNAGSGVGTRDYIYVEVEHLPSTMIVAGSLGAYCTFIKTDVGYVAKIMDPFGNKWLTRTRSKPQLP